MKITTDADLAWADARDGRPWLMVSRRRGSGWGSTRIRFEAGRTLWLGGVRFDGEAGLDGHSDGDVVCHALADALLGALRSATWGSISPTTIPRPPGSPAPICLTRVVALLAEAGRRPASCDLTVVCDRPAIATHRDEMRSRIGAVLGLPIDRVSVKATRPEGLGLMGDGVGCLAVAMVS